MVVSVDVEEEFGSVDLVVREVGFSLTAGVVCECVCVCALNTVG